MGRRTQQHYESVAYTGADLGRDEHARIEAIRAVIPPGVRQVLDCGCGDGRLGRTIKDDYEVVGCDVASASLAECPFRTVSASAADLPFEDGCFDLVISSEMLEHILPDEYEVACREIERVARKWIIVTVPNREDMDRARQQCPHCGTIFHDAWHLRRMDEELVGASFPSFAATHWFYVGHKVRWDTLVRARLRNRLRGYPRLRPERQCPLCARFGTDSGRRPEAAYAFRATPGDGRPEWYKALRRLALRIAPGRSRWLGCVLQRR